MAAILGLNEPDEDQDQDQDQELQDQELQDQEMQDQELQDQELQDQEMQDQEMQDRRYEDEEQGLDQTTKSFLPCDIDHPSNDEEDEEDVNIVNLKSSVFSNDDGGEDENDDVDRERSLNNTTRTSGKGSKPTTSSTIFVSSKKSSSQKSSIASPSNTSSSSAAAAARGAGSENQFVDIEEGVVGDSHPFMLIPPTPSLNHLSSHILGDDIVTMGERGHSHSALTAPIVPQSDPQLSSLVPSHPATFHAASLPVAQGIDTHPQQLSNHLNNTSSQS